jgi:threonine synthase
MYREMNYVSTNNNHLNASFKEAVLQGLPSGGGLFVPQFIPQPDPALLELFDDLPTEEIAFHLLQPFVGNDLSEIQLREVIRHAFSFEIPIVQIGDSPIHVLELFHGPTWAFKDVGARFLAGCLSAWREDRQDTVILVATSGDTGGAVASGFYNQRGVKVVILYPKGKISPLQEMQIAGLGGNITALAVEGDFDDCQRMVKSAFADLDLRSKMELTSANSINIARWLPQMVFYALAWKTIKRKAVAPVLCIPSGNYGNISAAFLAHTMGMHFHAILAAHNENATIPRFLESGAYEPQPTITTLANAMDVSDPSNFVRLQYLQQHQYRGRLAAFDAVSVSDSQIIEAIQDAWFNHQYLMDPHTATAWHVLKLHGGKGVVVSTAHPYKFEEVIVKALGAYPSAWRKEWKSGPINSMRIVADYAALNKALRALVGG